MKVSVVIPALNEANYIGACLKSLLAQTVKPYEVIVVDNNSRDKTAQIAKELGARIIHESQQGIVYARNAGFNAARSEIIARCDADTVLPVNWIEEIVKVFEKHNIVAVSGPVYYYDAPFFMRLPIYSRLFFVFMRLLQGHHTLLGFNMAVKREAWNVVKEKVCNDPVIHEDIDLSIHLAKIGKVFYDTNLIVQSSARRIIKSPYSFFIKYPLMLSSTLLKKH